MRNFYRTLLFISLSSTSVIAGVCPSKLGQKFHETVNWEEVWQRSSYLESPNNDKPIKNLKKIHIESKFKGIGTKSIKQRRWNSSPLFVRHNNTILRPERYQDWIIFAPKIYFTVNDDTKHEHETTPIKLLPLYKTGEDFPCAIVIQSKRLNLINEEIPEGHFSVNRLVSNFGKFEAKTVDSVRKVFLYVTMLPNILSAVGLKLPDDASINGSHVSSSIRVNRFYHNQMIDFDDQETDSIHHDCRYDSLLDKGKLGLSIMHMQPGRDFKNGNGRGFLLIGMSTEPMSDESNVFLVPADKKYLVIMLADHSLHGTERWSKGAAEGVYRTSYNFRISFKSSKDPLDLWKEIINLSWK